MEEIKKRERRIKIVKNDRNDESLLLGSHVSMSGKKMLLGSSEEAASYGANTFMIYTGAPQNTRRKPIEELNIEAGLQHMKENGMSNIVVHAPYIINIANTTKPETFDLGVDFLQKEIERTAALGCNTNCFTSRCPCWCRGRCRNCKNC